MKNCSILHELLSLCYSRSFSVSGIASASLSVNGFYDGVSVDDNGYFNFQLPFCPGEVVIKALADRYVPTVKVLDVQPETQGTVENVQVVLSHLALPIPVIVGEENILETSGAVRIIIQEGTTFLDKNGNEVRDNVNAIMSFIDPSNPNFNDSPGRFITDRGEELISLGLFQLQFRDTAGDSLTPNGGIRIVLVGSFEPGYKLWLLNTNGKWTEKISSAVIGDDQGIGSLVPRKKRQAGNTDLGSFGIDDLGHWITIGMIANAGMCYIKTRVFDDISFINEVVDNGVDQYKPKLLLKIGISAPFQGLKLDRPPTFSPGQTCFEVRCGANIQGIVSVMTQETLGSGQSIPVPAIPIQLTHSALPSSLNTALGALRYQVDTLQTAARLDFKSSPTGPFYQDETTCQNSAISDNALWFTPRAPVFTRTDIGSDVCYARIRIFHRAYYSVLPDQVIATSVWRNAPRNYADFIAQNNEIQPTFPRGIYVTCIRYRCSQPSDLTTVYIEAIATIVGFTCYGSELIPPAQAPSAPETGYYIGVDEATVKQECLSESNPWNTVEETRSLVSCFSQV